MCYFEKCWIVIFVGGIGSLYFLMDMIVVLWVVEINVDVILMAKNGVDGVYLVDFNKDVSVVKFDMFIYFDIINKGL